MTFTAGIRQDWTGCAGFASRDRFFLCSLQGKWFNSGSMDDAVRPGNRRLGELTMRSSPSKRHAVRTFLALAVILAAGIQAEDACNLKPEKAPERFQQRILPVFDVQTDVSKEYLTTLVTQISKSEAKMYDLFKFTAGFLKGNMRGTRLGVKYPIPGDTLGKAGYKPWVEVRVYKNYEDFCEEYFTEIDRLESLVNNTQVRQQTPEQRAMRRMTEGVPGAYYMRISDYDKKYVLRRIRAFMGSQTPEEVETQILHEMGHLFLETFLMEFAGAPKRGQEDQKRGTPAWIAEGIAQLFEINWGTSRVANRLKAQNRAMMYCAIKDGDSYPFDQFVNVTNAHNLMAVATDPLKSRINYIQSYSVMMYMVEKAWPNFLQFLENLRAKNFEANKKDPKRISELYSVQAEAFKEAFGILLPDLEHHWKKQATETFEAELVKKPGLYYWCGEYYLLKKDTARAEEQFKLAAEKAPKSGEGYMGLGRVALMKNEIPVALEHFAKAIEFSPDEEDGYYYRGIALQKLGQFKESAESLQLALKYYPRYHQAHAHLAEALIQLHDFKSAMEHYEQAYQIQRNNPYYLLGKGRAALFGGDNQEAQKNFAIFTRVFPRNAEGQFWYALAMWRLGGQEQQALSKMREATQLDPKNEMIGSALAKMNKGEELRFAVESGKPGEKPVTTKAGTTTIPLPAGVAEETE
jgi:tetratricopeptide (TPR) repeat protein